MGRSLRRFRSQALTFDQPLAQLILGWPTSYFPSLIHPRSADPGVDHTYTSLNHHAEKRYQIKVWAVWRWRENFVKIVKGEADVRAPKHPFSVLLTFCCQCSLTQMDLSNPQDEDREGCYKEQYCPYTHFAYWKPKPEYYTGTD